MMVPSNDGESFDRRILRPHLQHGLLLWSKATAHGHEKTASNTNSYERRSVAAHDEWPTQAIKTLGQDNDPMLVQSTLQCIPVVRDSIPHCSEIQSRDSRVTLPICR